MQNRTRIFLWCLYDFANSLAFVNVSFSFGLWFISEHGASDAWMSASVALTTVTMLLVLPVLGRMSDDLGRRLPFLAACTMMSILALLGLGAVASTVTAFTLPITVLVFLLYSAFNLFYMASFAFYDALLRGLATGRQSLEGLSGFGMALGQVGNVVGLLIAMPIAGGTISLFGITGRGGVFIAAALLFFVASLPTFLFFREASHTRLSEAEKIGKTLRETIRDLRHIRRYPGVLPYLITYALFADALLTLTLFASFYLQAVGHMDDAAKTVTFIYAIVAGIAGSLASPLILRICGGRKRAVTACIALWTVVLVGMGLARQPVLFTILVALNGFAFAALFSLSRAFFAVLVPPQKQAEMFSLYALFERTASVIGPLLWSATAAAFSSFGDDKYRFSVFSLALLIGVSLVIFQFVREPFQTR